ncbi:hypothetical protein HYH03_005228 [Edaphochlamys debaryana]|uniref:PA domain-containing protein n=1 Tax=Edaphochlamys debaryana TaxID=47281 RepID=A0A835Y891_9CHLO|nr:hypothetical protein HYH03_005228 [Edaphochlamys debaryana]|eukprot:KAG2496822.1 hypothetical protein HYH03_005228 [Edaphochlamys debaryana]
MRLAGPLVLALLIAHSAQAKDECYGRALVKLEVELSSADANVVSYGALAGFGSNLSQPLEGLQIAVAKPLLACDELEPAPGKALLVLRGNCTFTDKARAVQAAGAAAMLLYDSEPNGCVTIGYEANKTAGITVAVVSINQALGQRWGDMLDPSHVPPVDLKITLESVGVPLVDTGAVLLWLLAVGTVVAGSVWSGADLLAARKAAAEEEQAALIGGRRKAPAAPPHEVMDLTPRAALGFVLLASAMLLLLYFLLNKVFFFVLLGLFCVASIQSQTALYAAGLEQLLPPARAAASLTLPFFGVCPLPVLLTLPLAVAVAVVWAVWRNAPWAWVLQDLQGVALMLLVLRTLRVTRLKVAAVLLPACLLYDVFWVFIQPMLFGNGDSVMVTVAQGGTSGEFIPMLLRVPHFGFGGMGGYSLLGFGDVILPGLLVAFTRRLDVDLSLHGVFRAAGGAPSLFLYISRAYFPYAVLLYGGGLCLTYAALAFSWFGDQGQPALLYLVPCTLGGTVALAAVRGQLGALWRAGSKVGGAGDAGDGDEAGGLAESYGLLSTADHDSDAGDLGVGSGPAAGLGAGTGTGGAGPDVEAGSGPAAGRDREAQRRRAGGAA